MSKAVKSDGKDDKLVRQLVANGFTRPQRAQIDVVLRDNTILRRLAYQTLVMAQCEYMRAYDEANWAVHLQMEYKAAQSSAYRDYRDGADTVPSDDVLAALKKRAKDNN
jgi:hypothetical protein